MQSDDDEPSMQLARDRVNDRASATRDAPLPATVLAGVLSIIEGVMGAKIDPEQPLMEVWIGSLLSALCPPSTQSSVKICSPDYGTCGFSCTNVWAAFCWAPNDSTDQT